MKRLIPLFFFHCLMLSLHAQKDHYMLLVDKAKSFEAGNPDSILLYASKAMGTDADRIDAKYWMGTGLRLKNEYDSALFWYNQYKDGAKTALEKGNAHMGIGGVLYGQGMYPEAHESFSEAAKLFSQIGEKERYASALMNIGIISGIGGNYDKAIEHYLEALEIFRSLNLIQKMLPTLVNLATIYEHQEEYDSSIYYGQWCFNIADSLKLEYAMAQAIKSLAPSHIKTGNFELGLSLALEGKQLFRAMGIKVSEATMLLNEVEALLMLDRTEEALRLSKTLLTNEYVFKEDLYLLLARVYEKKLDFRNALNYYEKYHEEYEKEEAERNSKQLNQLEIKFETAQKDYEILKLENQLMSQKAKTSRQTWLLTWVGSFVLLVGLIGWLVYQKKLMKVSEQSAIHRHQLLRSQINPHFIFNSLSAIRGFLFERDNNNPVITYLGKFAKLMRMVLELSSKEWVTLKEELNALELYLDIQQIRFNRSFEFTLIIDPTIDSQNVIVPPLTAQPFIENAIEHGLKGIHKDGKVEIACSRKNNKLIITIQDNGIGIDQIEPRKGHQSRAIQIFKERLQMISKQMKTTFAFTISDLKSSSKTGTLVTYELPLLKSCI